MSKRNLKKENEDLKNIVKFFIKQFSFGDNEIAISPNKINEMKKYELCEFKNLLSRERIFKIIGNEDLYGKKFYEENN